MVKINWCNKAQKVCGFGMVLRNMKIVDCPVSCKDFTTLMGSCDTCKEYHVVTEQEAVNLGYSRKFYKAHREDIHWCCNELVGAEGCMYYKPKE